MAWHELRRAELQQQNQRLSALSAQLRRETDKSLAELQRKVSGTNLSSEMTGSKKYPIDSNRFTDDVAQEIQTLHLPESIEGWFDWKAADGDHAIAEGAER